MNIVIFGASGTTGHLLVKQALTQGHRITAFLRLTSKLNVSDPNLRILRGDITNLQQVTDALQGQDAAISALGASSPFRYDESVVNGFRIIILAMSLAQVHRFVYLSFVGVSDSRQYGGVVVRYIAPILLSTEIKGHEIREQMVVDSQLVWTIVRPPTLTNGKHSGKYRSGERIKSKRFAAMISRADVAEFMLTQLKTEEYLHAKVSVMY